MHPLLLWKEKIFNVERLTMGEEPMHMLFHVKHVHTHETCPAGNPELTKKTFGTMVMPDHASKTGVKLLASYADAPAHTVYFIVEADHN